MPKISVIVPTYNCANYLSEALTSLFRQVYQDFEIIIIDDGSIDNTKDIIDKYDNQHKGRIRYFYQKNSGVPKARNKGIMESRGEYIALLDADDEFVPDSLERCFNAIENDNADWCITDIWRVDGKSAELQKSNIYNNHLFMNILKDDWIRRTVLVKKDALFEIGLYDENLLNREDWDLNIRLIKENKKFVYLNSPLYIYKLRNKSITKGRNPQLLLFTLKLLQKHHKKLADQGNKEIAKIYSENTWDLARKYFYEMRDIKKSLYCIKESLKYDFNLKRIRHTMISLFKRK